MIRRMITEEDAQIVDAIANDKRVRETMFLGMRYHQDNTCWEDVIKDQRNHVLVDEGFCAIFAWSSPRVYECHIMAVQEARGASLFVRGKAMLQYMKDCGAVLIWGQPSIYNRAAICYIRRMGLVTCGFGTSPVVGDVQYFVTEGL